MEKKYSWELEGHEYNSFALAKNMFDYQQIEEIVAYCERNELHLGSVFTNETNFNNVSRSSKVNFLEASENNSWIFRTLVDSIQEINKNFFNFDLQTIECIQYTVYDKDDFYVKHIDTLPLGPGNLIRKLSFVVQLSDEKEYEGGNLNLWTWSTPTVLTKQKGSVLFFPSFVLHEVTPVTRGTRRSLVGWVIGKGWK